MAGGGDQFFLGRKLKEPSIKLCKTQVVTCASKGNEI